MTAIKALCPESNTLFLHEGSREIGTMSWYASSAQPHGTATKSMKHLRDPLLEGGQFFHSCAWNISGQNRFCICTRYCTQLPTQEAELQVPAVNMVLLLVEEREHHPQGADGRRQCRTGEPALGGTRTWKFLEPSQSTVGSSFPWMAWEFHRVGTWGKWKDESQRARMRETKLPVTHTTCSDEYATWST